MDYKLEDIVDIPLLQELQEKLNAIYSFPSAIIDNEGKILTAVAWQDICTKFHRTNPESEKECIKSDKYILEHLHEANPAVSYTCPHGMTDNATPIIIEGRHLGNFFTGQFFIEKPDIEFFKKQAAHFGFDEKEYLDAVEKVPVWTREKLAQYLDFIKGFIEIIAGIGLKNLKEIEAREELNKVNKELATSRLTAIKIMNSAIESKQNLEIANKNLSDEIEERKRAKVAEMDINKKFLSLASNMPGYVAYVNAQTLHYEFVNDAFEKSFGIPKAKIEGSHIKDIIGESNYQFALNYINQVRAGKSISYENVFNLVTGKRWISVNYNPVFDEYGNVDSIAVLSYDITERKQAAEALSISENRLSDIIFSLGDWVWELDKNGVYTYSSQKGSDIFGISRENIIGKTPFDFMSEEEIQRVAPIFSSIVTKKEPIKDLENWNIDRNGKRICFLTNGVPILDDAGNLLGYRGVDKDITERKLAEEKLRISDEKLRLHLDNSPLAIIEWDSDYNVIRWAGAAEKIFGWSADETIGKPISELKLIYEEDIPDVQKVVERLKSGKELFVVSSNRNYTKNRNIIYCEWNNSIVLDNYGKMASVLSQVSDITSRKLAIDNLKENEERWKKAIVNSPIPIMIHDEDDNVIQLSDGWTKYSGYTIDDIPTMEDWTDRAYGERAGSKKDYIYNLFKIDKTVKNGEWIVTAKDGSKRIWDFQTTPLGKNSKGKRVLHSMAIDITERKQAVEALLLNKQKLELAQRSAGAGFWDWDMKDNSLDWSPELYTIFGLDRNINKPNFETWNKALYPDDIEIAAKRIDESIKYKTALNSDYRIINKEGELRWIKALGDTTYDSWGNPVRMSGICIDITESKRAEEALRNSESQLAIAVEMARLGPWEYDIDSDTFTFNDYFYAIFRTTAEREGGYKMSSEKYAQRFVHPDDVNQVAIETQKAIETTDPEFSRQIEHRIIYADGKMGYITVRFYIIKDSQGRTIKTYGVNQDITERKIAEEVIKQSYERYQALIQTTIDGYWATDLEGNIIEVNDSYCKMSGYKKEQLLKMKIHDVEYFENEEETRERIKKLVNSGWLRFESKHKCADGSSIDVEISTTYLDDQKIILAFFTNTTSQKNAEIALKESENRYKMLANNSTDVIWTMDLTGKFTYISPSIEKLRGYTVEEILQQPFEEVISPGSRNEVMRKLQKRISSAFDGAELGVDISEVEQPCKDGSTVWTEVVTDLLRDEHGRAIGIIGISRNITERKLAQDALIENEERYKKAQEVGKVGSWEYNIIDDTFWGSEEGKRIYGFNLTTDVFSAKEVMNRVINRSHVDQTLVNLIQKNEPYNIEFEIIPLNSSEKRTIHSVAQLVCDKNGSPVKVTGVLQDITERKLIEEERKHIIELLRIMNVTNSKSNLIESVIGFLKQWLKCDAVGVRLKEGDDFPYYETSGFPEKFVRAEKYLCSYDLNGDINRDSGGNPILDCMCGNVLCGRFDVSKEFFTEHGSFWSNCTTELLTTTSEADRQARTRNRCNGEGYESVGLFPLRFRGETIGLLQINNKMKGLFTPGIISFLERIGDNLSIALSNHLSRELLQQSEEKYRKLFSEMRNGFALNEIICDENVNPVDYVTLEVNAAFENLLDVKRDMVIGMKAGDFMTPEELKHWLNIFSPVALTGKSTQYEMFSAVNKKYFEGIAYSPEPMKFAVVFYDITERKQAEKELELHRNHLEELVKKRTEELDKVNMYLQREIEKDKELEMMLQKSLEKEKELNELKSRFISTTSHEFRTPLTALLLSTDLIKRYGGKWSEEKKNEHLDKIRSSVKYLTTLLEDILTLNRAETGEISYKPEVIDFYKFSEDCIGDAKSLMNDTHKLKFNYKSEDKDFYLDTKLMRFILNNLLSNAIKYSPSGGEIKYNVSATKKYLKLEVSDEGIGIPADEVGKIFDSFYRSRNAEDMAGTGLGLAIVKRAVELHHGEITVSSEIGKGTTFIVKIPKVVK